LIGEDYYPGIGNHRLNMAIIEPEIVVAKDRQDAIRRVESLEEGSKRFDVAFMEADVITAKKNQMWCELIDCGPDRLKQARVCKWARM